MFDFHVSPSVVCFFVCYFPSWLVCLFAFVVSGMRVIDHYIFVLNSRRLGDLFRACNKNLGAQLLSWLLGLIPPVFFLFLSVDSDRRNMGDGFS